MQGMAGHSGRKMTIFAIIIYLLILLTGAVEAKGHNTNATTKHSDLAKKPDPHTAGKKEPDSRAADSLKKPAERPRMTARMDSRHVVSGDETKELIPAREAYVVADLNKGEITPPEEGSNPGLSDEQRRIHRCRDSQNTMHALGSVYIIFGTECTYYECEYYADLGAVAWVLSRDIFKCCFEDKYGYKDTTVMQGKCTKKVCMRDGKDNSYEGSMGWELRETGCIQCSIGLVILEKGETFYTGDPCLSFQCGDKSKLKPVINHTCCHVNDSLIADGQLALTRVEDVCEVSTCKAGHFTNKTNYQPLISVDDYVSGCPVNWVQIQGYCYFSFTKPQTLQEAARRCSLLAPASNSQLMRVDYGGMIGTMSDVMELGRWYWLVLRTKADTPHYMWTYDETTPERFLVGHHEQPTVKRVNHQGKLAFQRAASDRNAYVCQMDHTPSCKPTGYKEEEPSSGDFSFHQEF